MGEDRTRKFCKDCDQNVLAVRKGTNHILHLILSLVTIGFWIPVWIVCAIKIGGYKCPTCGGGV